jgi:glycine cleavage system transcriptional repressor
MRHLAVSAIGRDRPGIVAAVSEVLLEHEGNIEDSQMTILRGHFTIMLIVSTPDVVDLQRLRGDLERAGERLGLEAVSLNEVTELEAESETLPSHIVTVYGVDHPGIVHSVTSTLAEGGINITDLETRVVIEEGEEPLYLMMMEVALPRGVSLKEAEEPLRAVGEREGVDLTIRPLEQDAL